MSFGKTTLALLLFLALAAGNVSAASRGLLWLGGLRQSVGLQYDYSFRETRTETSSTSSSDHGFGEFYRAGIFYAVYDPRVLNGRFQTRLTLNQGFASSGRDGDATDYSKFSFLYYLDGKFFERETAPITFFSGSEIKHTARSFAPSYDLKTTRHGISARVDNDYFPAHFSYTRTISETDGLSADRKYELDQFSLGGRHLYRNSDTDLLFSVSQSDAEGIESGSRNFAASSLFSGRNRLFTSDRRKTLTSSVRYLQADRGEGATMESISVSEGFTWDLGRALTFGSNYNWVSTETMSKRGDRNNFDSHFGGVRLTHRLFQSLVSNFGLQVRKSNFDDGDEASWTGTAEFDYRKILTPDSVLDLHYIESLTQTDRNLESQIQNVFGEELTIAIFEDNLLANPDVVISSIIVRDAENPAIRYFSDTESLTPDFRVIQLGAFVGLDVAVPGSRLIDGTRVEVSYSYTGDPKAHFTANQRSLSAGLSLKDGYRVFGSFSQTYQHYSEGGDSKGAGDSYGYSLGVSRSVEGKFGSLIYAKQDAPTGSRQYLDGLFRSQHYYWDSMLMVQVGNRYTWFDLEAGDGSQDWENRFSLTASGSRRLYRNGMLRLSTQYLNVRSDATTLEGINVECDYRWQRGKLAVEAKARTGYRNIDGDDKVWDSKFFLSVSREF